MLNSVSDFPTYWIRQILHSRRYINSFHLQLKSWEIWYVFCVTLILENWVCRTCLPHKFLNLEKHMVENPIFFFLESLGSFSSTIFLHPSRSKRFLFLLNAKIRGSWNASLNSWLIWSKFQLLDIALFTLGYVRLYDNTSGILLLYLFSFSSRSFFLSKVLVLSISLFISCCLYTFSINLLSNLLQLSWTHYLLSRCGEDVKLVQMVCLVLKTQSALICDVNKLVYRILLSRAWFSVYLLCFINDSIEEIYLFIRNIKVKFYRWVDFINLLFKFH